MDQLTKYANEILKWLEAYGIAEKDPMLLVSFAASLLALLIAVSNRRKLKQVGVFQLDGVKRRTETLDLRLTDALGSFQAEHGKLREKFLQLKARHPDLFEELPELDSERVSAPAPKKKTESPEQPALVDEVPTGASLFSGLAKTRKQFFSRLSALVSGKSQLSEDTYDELEELLITSDLGVSTSHKLLKQLQNELSEQKELSDRDVRRVLQSAVLEILSSDGPAEILPKKRGSDPLVLLIVGVNGVGKTTTIGKLAKQFTAQGAKVLLGACDTFRAAAEEQIEIWAKRVGVEVVRGEQGAKPTTVAYQAIHRARDEGFDVLIIDTAGRLHTRVNLMNELANIVHIIGRELPGAPHESLLVLDASTGQNALQQAREFNERTDLSGIIITKLDGTPKGGIVVAIKDELDTPIRYVGVGEGVEDLRVFSAEEFVQALFAEDSAGYANTAGSSKMARRRRERA